ncbi:uncharacterized protein LOC134277244 [Saccostrea cucullata]|uniref:uncharacterized protein LOC134277244 n=1 Tax=Saccostrea cuccullata TaxID=36930 RepID=UPI002ED6763C
MPLSSLHFLQYSLVNHFVVINLETTGLISRNSMPLAHITRIACLDVKSKEKFSTYVLPKQQLDANVERATDIVFDGTSLYVRGQRVAAIPIKEALDNFLEWLKKFRDVVLLAHNKRVFDFRVLCSAITSVTYRKYSEKLLPHLLTLLVS